MTDSTPSQDTLARLQALQARSSGASPAPAASATAPAPLKKKVKPSGPAPSRIVAAAASVSAGIGLMALMGSTGQDVVVQVNPAPVTVQPSNIVVELQTNGETAQVRQVRVVEAATPVEQPAAQARVITQSEGS